MINLKKGDVLIAQKDVLIMLSGSPIEFVKGTKCVVYSVDVKNCDLWWWVPSHTTYKNFNKYDKFNNNKYNRLPNRRTSVKRYKNKWFFSEKDLIDNFNYLSIQRKDKLKKLNSCG